MGLEKLKDIITDYRGIKIPEGWCRIYNLKYNADMADLLDTALRKLDEIEPSESGNLKMLQLYMQHFTAYRHEDGKEFENGNIIKTICLLPFIAECGFNCIMLLPHFLRSEKFRKGTKGSPYSVKDYYTIDPYICDNYSGLESNELFGLLIKASHKCGIKILIDMVPRTAARDSLWILENPDWFYWIKPENTERLVSLLQTPVKDLPAPVSMTSEVIDRTLEGLPLKEISEMFEFSPKVTNPEKWDEFVAEHKNNPDFLDDLVREFGVITPPCTSDCVNDPQPAWTDVTPLRFFYDYPEKIMKKMGENILDRPPFFIQPVLKASNFPGNSPIIPLWDKICSIPSYYVEKFGVDGLRGDMFHALPSEMIDRMTGNIPEDFILIMENLDNNAGDSLSIEHDFDFYTGNLFTVIDEKPESLHYFMNQTAKLQTSILAMPVIGDSRPLLSKDRVQAFFQIAFSAFIPKSAFGITADTLAGNSLPLNYGLGFSQDDQKKFDTLLENKGRKLAYFNHDTLTSEWDNIDMEIIEHIKKVNYIKDVVFSEDLFLGNCTLENGLLFFELRDINGKVCYNVYSNSGEYKEFDLNGIIVYSYNNRSDVRFEGGKFSLAVCEVV